MRPLFAVTAVAIAMAMSAPTGVASPPAASETEPFFDSAMDGVWVGTARFRTQDLDVTYPLSLNLDADASRVTGLALLPDDLSGEAASWAFFALRGSVAANRLTAEVAASPVPGAAPQPREPLRLTLRLRKGALAGTVNAPDLRRGEVELRQVVEAAPLQHIWLEELPAIRAGGPLALALNQDEGVSGVGALGAESGPLTDVVFDGTRLSGSLLLPSGAVPFEFEFKNGRLRGGVSDSEEALELYAGGVRVAPTVTALEPESIPVGRPSAIGLRGKNLVPGFLLHFADAAIRPGVPAIESATAAQVLADVASTATVGKRVGAVVVGADGVARKVEDSLLLDAPQPISFENDLQPVLAASCAISGCHITPSPDPDFGIISPPGNLILEPAAAYTNLVGRPSAERPELLRVAPRDPDASYLIHKLRGGPDIVGERMPRNGPYLSDATIALFVAWIRDGAPRN